MDVTIGTVIDAYPLDELLYRGGAKSGGSTMIHRGKFRRFETRAINASHFFLFLFFLTSYAFCNFIYPTFATFLFHRPLFVR